MRFHLPSGLRLVNPKNLFLNKKKFILLLNNETLLSYMLFFVSYIINYTPGKARMQKCKPLKNPLHLGSKNGTKYLELKSENFDKNLYFSLKIT